MSKLESVLKGLLEQGEERLGPKIEERVGELIMEAGEDAVNDVELLGVVLECAGEELQDWARLVTKLEPFLQILANVCAHLGKSPALIRIQKQLVQGMGSLVRQFEDDGWSRDEAFRMAELTISAIRLR